MKSDMSGSMKLDEYTRGIERFEKALSKYNWGVPAAVNRGATPEFERLIRTRGVEEKNGELRRCLRCGVSMSVEDFPLRGGTGVRGHTCSSCLGSAGFGAAVAAIADHSEAYKQEEEARIKENEAKKEALTAAKKEARRIATEARRAQKIGAMQSAGEGFIGPKRPVGRPRKDIGPKEPKALRRLGRPRSVPAPKDGLAWCSRCGAWRPEAEVYVSIHRCKSGYSERCGRGDLL